MSTDAKSAAFRIRKGYEAEPVTAEIEPEAVEADAEVDADE